MNTKHLHQIRTATLATAIAFVACAGTTAPSFAEHAHGHGEAGTRSQEYTVLDHPSKPCHLSLEAVANWGETSAHLPQACTYGAGSRSHEYTVLDHPSKPCHLSLEAVANWGETSTHLPQACTYGE